MSLIVVSDTHIAKIWDEIDKIIPKDIDFLNPNKYFREVISHLNPEDLLVINGDLVEYFYDSYQEKRNSNWPIFFDILRAFKGKSLLNLGNHDYRKMPYNFSIYKLNHVNIPDKVLGEYRNKIGFSKFRFLREFESIAVNLRKFNPIPPEISKVEKKIDWEDSEILILDTGPDALTSFKNILKPWKWKFVLSGTPSAVGLKDREIKLLKDELFVEKSKEILLFLHCSPFLSDNGIPEIKLEKKSYWKNIRKYGLTFSTFLENNWEFIESLMNSDRNIIVIASHAHIPKQYMIDKYSKTLRESSIEEINNLRKESRYIKFVYTLPLGYMVPSKKIGYLVIDREEIKYKIIKEFE